MRAGQALLWLWAGSAGCDGTSMLDIEVHLPEGDKKEGISPEEMTKLVEEVREAVAKRLYDEEPGANPLVDDEAEDTMTDKAAKAPRKGMGGASDSALLETSYTGENAAGRAGLLGAFANYSPEEMKIGTDKNLFTTLINNLDDIKRMGHRPGVGKITGVAIFRDEETNSLTDLWRRLQFERRNGAYVDSTSYFEGTLKESREALIRDSRMSKTGFFIEAKADGKEEWRNVRAAKKLVAAVAQHKGMSVSALMSKNRPLTTVEDVIFTANYPLKRADVVEVCVCPDNDCSLPCVEKRRVERRHFL